MNTGNSINEIATLIAAAVGVALITLGLIMVFHP